MIELEKDAFDTHDYVESLMREKNEEFNKNYHRFRKKYTLD